MFSIFFIFFLSFKFETTKNKDLSHYEGLSSSFIGFSGPIEDRENHLQIKKNPLISQTVHSKPEISLLEKHEKKSISEKLEPWDENVRNDPQYTVYYVTSIFNELKLQEVFAYYELTNKFFF